MNNLPQSNSSKYAGTSLNIDLMDPRFIPSDKYYKSWSLGLMLKVFSCYHAMKKRLKNDVGNLFLNFHAKAPINSYVQQMIFNDHALQRQVSKSTL